MKDRIKIREALATAIITQLWLKGLLTDAEKQRLTEKSPLFFLSN